MSTAARQPVIGLTGGIASGKSAVAERFAARGVVVVDADEVAREVVAPGAPALARIVERFGADVLDPSGALDRRRLRGIVFADPAARRSLEGLLHPLIHARMAGLIEAAASAYCIACSPLLLEAGQRDLVDRILVVDVPEDVQVRRVIARDGSSQEQARAILRSQVRRAERLAAADFVITNDSDLHALDAAVARLHEVFLELAVAARGAS